jgi:3-dehydroquinate synthetase
MMKSYALVMSKADTRYVACSDKTEIERVRENFLKKKLGITSGDMDASIKAICEAMKADKTKSRLTFYYLLAEHYGKLDIFVKK